MIHKYDVTIRIMRESDFPYMAKWLNDDLVIEYYGPRLTLEKVIAKYGPRINKENYVMPCIVEYKEESMAIFNIIKFLKSSQKYMAIH